LTRESLKGKFYEQEIQRVEKRDNDLFEIEKILKTRKRGSRVEYYVKWKGLSGEIQQLDVGFTMSHFYITLPSDSSANYYPDNTIARFVTKLPERIRLEGEYEMGLAEIIYPHTWYNVDNEDEKYRVAAIGVGRNRMQTVHLPSGYYESGSDIATVLNREFSRLVQDVRVEFSYSGSIDRFSLSVQTRGSQIFAMSEDLQRYVGFDLSTISLDPLSFGTMAKQAFDVNRGLNLLYVYCDVATHTIVGDTKTPFLRTCNVTGQHGEFVRHTYVQPHYVPVRRREFDSVEIAINNELGKPMPFEYESRLSHCTFAESALFRETMDDHLYLAIPSYAYVNYYPDNTASRFVVKLPERVRLEGNYEVGCRVRHPSDWLRLLIARYLACDEQEVGASAELR
jgi:hypothetical protein